MGLLDALLGASNPLASWADSNPYTLPALGAGIASGTSLAGGFANAATNLANARQPNLQYQLAQNQLQLASQGANATADWLEQQQNPNLQALAGPVRNRTISGEDALKMAFAPGQSLAPGSTLMPNQMGPNYAPPSGQPIASATQASGPPPSGPSAPLIPDPSNATPAAINSPQQAANFYQGFTGNQASAAAPIQVAANTQGIGMPALPTQGQQGQAPAIPQDTRAALMQGLGQVASPLPLAPIQPTTSAPQPATQAAYDPSQPYQVPATNPMQMTPQQRQDLGRQYGLSGAPLASFTVSGRMPSNVAQQGTWQPASQQDRAKWGISPADPGVYRTNTMTGEIQQVPGAISATASNPAGGTPVSLGPNGDPDPVQQQQFLSNLDPGMASMVKGVIDYRLDPAKVTSMRGNQREQLIQLATQADPTFDMSQYAARVKMRQSVSSGTFGQNITSANTAIQHLGELDAAVDKLGNTDIVPFNAAKNAGAQMTGNAAVTTFKQTATAAADELAKLFKGTGVSDVQTIKSWGEGLDVNGSPAQLHGAIQNAINNLLKARLDTLESQYTQTMGRPPDFTFIKPAAAQVLNKMGIDPDSLDPGAANAQQPATSTAQAAAPDIASVYAKYGIKP